MRVYGTGPVEQEWHGRSRYEDSTKNQQLYKLADIERKHPGTLNPKQLERAGKYVDPEYSPFREKTRRNVLPTISE
jgi:hypothetical protein